MRRIAFFVPLLACACATLTTPVPKEVRLSRQDVIVSMSNGDRCTGLRSQATATATGWSGRLRGCAEALPYEVRLDPRGNLVQGVLVQAFDAVGAKGILAPGGEVRVTDARGQVRSFVSPEPIHWGRTH